MLRQLVDGMVTSERQTPSSRSPTIIRKQDTYQTSVRYTFDVLEIAAVNVGFGYFAYVNVPVTAPVAYLQNSKRCDEA